MRLDCCWSPVADARTNASVHATKKRPKPSANLAEGFLFCVGATKLHVVTPTQNKKVYARRCGHALKSSAGRQSRQTDAPPLSFLRSHDGDCYCLAAVVGLRIFCKNFWCSPEAAASSVCTVLASAASFLGSALPDFSSMSTLSSAARAFF